MDQHYPGKMKGAWRCRPSFDMYSIVQVERKVVDEEYLPFKEDSLEAVVSSMSMHWVNDLPGKKKDARYM